LEKRVNPNVLGKRLHSFLWTHNNRFEEVAKFSAARKNVGKDHERHWRSGRKKSDLMLRFHTQTGGSSLMHSSPELISFA